VRVLCKPLSTIACNKIRNPEKLDLDMSYDAADSVSNLSKNIIMIHILENACVANIFDG